MVFTTWDQKCSVLELEQFTFDTFQSNHPVVQKLALKKEATAGGDIQERANDEKQTKEPLLIKTQDSQTQIIEDQTQQSTQSSTTNRKRRSPVYIVPHDVGTNYKFNVIRLSGCTHIFDYLLSILESFYRRAMGTMR